jgi:hypothetical protein
MRIAYNAELDSKFVTLPTRVYFPSIGNARDACDDAMVAEPYRQFTETEVDDSEVCDDDDARNILLEAGARIDSDNERGWTRLWDAGPSAMLARHELLARGDRYVRGLDLNPWDFEETEVVAAIYGDKV